MLYVVDDDVATCVLLCEIAADAGWETRGFVRLAELRSALATQMPALLIVDDDLPDGRGGDLARELREDVRMGQLPVAVCTAAQPMRQAEIGGWAPVISKPFDLAEIETFLTAAARRHAGADSFDRRAG